ncbi:MAG: ABC transporter substrate-binding protein [Reyranella sp.]|uniref:ABC transporter substrate-binding protein n=1 Tax=Reyranella sp. TaxID=1929291 RepID=UPI0011FE5709|nr:ABC transporter substrate-binding protein [Reyranella sp.]TAJ40495.1 MAG: ABC transporter substrate-binding protein [Reyranella sp.]
MIRLSENFRALFYAPFYATQATGAFAAAGVEVAMIPSPSPGAAVAVLRAGEVDVMWGGPLRVMMLHDQEPGCDLICFCDVVARDPFFVIGAKPKPDFRFADLVGLRVATVSEVPTPWICLANDLRGAGVDPAALDRVDDQTMAENEVGLAAGSLDAIQVFQPYAERLIASGAGHLWYAAATRGLTAYTTLVTRRDVLTERAEELERMTRAVHRTLRWFAKTPALEIAGLLKDYFPDLPTPIFAACINRYRALGLWGPDPIIRREGYERLHAAMRASGALSRDIAFAACVDTAMAEKAVRA